MLHFIFIAYVNVTLRLQPKLFSLISNYCPNRTFPPHWAIQSVALFFKKEEQPVLISE